MDGLCCVAGVDALEDLSVEIILFRSTSEPPSAGPSKPKISLTIKRLETANKKKKKVETSTTNHNPTPQLFPDLSLPRNVPSRHHCLAHRRHCRPTPPRLQDISKAPPTPPELSFLSGYRAISCPEEQKQRDRGSFSPPAKTPHQTLPQTSRFDAGQAPHQHPI